MKALSIRQPYPWAIINGWKPVENRTWSTSHRGGTLIHAGKAEMKADVEHVIRQIAEQTGRRAGDVLRQYHEERQLGGVVGMALLTDVVTKMENPWFFGPFGFVFAAPQKLTFTPMNGALGFFDVPDDSIAKPLP